MNELTNVLTENRKFKEKSLSVSNLYMDDIKKKNALNYSRSFSIEPAFTLKNFKITTYETNGVEYNRRLSNSNEKLYDNEINYRNSKNLEKSSSMECINVNENRNLISDKEENFRKPVAPVQKKLKAKRSASSVGARNSLDMDQNEEMPSEAILRQQFLEFLKEKKIMNSDFNIKSLEVLKNILPQLDSQIVDNSQEKEKVKIVDVKLKEPIVELKEEKIEEKVEEVIIEKPEISLKKPEIVSKHQDIVVNKPELNKRYSYQGPPSINFGTWGERPRTKVIIKDEDYITQDKINGKLEEKPSIEANSSAPKYREILRKTPQQSQIFKKPSNYEIFSALPKKKDISSIELVRLEDEEKKRRDPSRVPIVCGVELKKDVKPEPEVKPLKHSVSEISIKPEPKPKLQHSVSVYVNGNQDKIETKAKPSGFNFMQPKRNSLMPVVKGFRSVEEVPSQSHVNNNVINNKNVKNETTNDSSAINNNIEKRIGGIPPPPPVGLINLKPVASRQLKPKSIGGEDARGQLMEEIRNFGGLKKLKKETVQ